MGKKLSKAAKKRQACDRRLRKVYGRSLDWYEATLKEQGNGCAICHRPAKILRLHVDHDHKLLNDVRFKKLAKKHWIAVSNVFPKIKAHAKTKKAVVRKIRNKLKSRSVRGILCWQCNPGLKKFGDDPVKLANAAKYLRRYLSKRSKGERQ